MMKYLEQFSIADLRAEVSDKTWLIYGKHRVSSLSEALTSNLREIRETDTYFFERVII